MLRLLLYKAQEGKDFDNHLNPVMLAGFDFPRGPGAYALRFFCGLLDFSDYGPKIVGEPEILFLTTYFYQKTFLGP